MPATLASPDIDYLRDLVCQTIGNSISQQQSYLFEQRLAPLLQQHELKSIADLVTRLKTRHNPTLRNQVVEAMTINETSFFRDMHPFAALRDHIFPQLAKTRATEKRVSIWCAASSSGQEPYSIAMTFAEHFPQRATWNLQITATDISDTMLEKCRSGNYTQFEVNRGLPTPLLVKYFDRHGTQWCVKPEIRRLIDFRKLNLFESFPYMAQHDIVFIRNVLIYFAKERKLEILKRVRRVLKPDGYLFLGGGETLINLNTDFVREEVGGTVCYRPST
ncbi:MAG: protein-glutamate O-methyltransferase CheR [Pirellulaceae bacterium]